MSLTEDLERRIFLMEVVSRARAAKAAMLRLEQLIAARGNNAAQCLLTAFEIVEHGYFVRELATVPDKGSRKARTIARAKRIVPLLAGVSTQPLADAAKVRNSIQHLAERIDDYLIEFGVEFAQVDGCVAEDGVNEFMTSDGRLMPVRGRVGPETLDCQVFEDTVQLRELVACLDQLEKKAIEGLRTVRLALPGDPSEWVA